MSRTISIGQLRQNPTGMIRDVRHGAAYILTDRGQAVADIVPHRASAWRDAADAGAVLTRLGADPAWLAESNALRDEAALDDPWRAES